MNNSFIQKLTCLVEANLANEKYGPKELAIDAGISHSSLNRKLRFSVDKNSSQFIREIRLKKAKEYLQNEDLTVAETSYKVGFGSPTYFNKCFNEYFGYSPGELRNHKQEDEPEEKQLISLTGKRKNPKIRIGLIIFLIFLIPTTYFLIHQITKSKSSRANEKSIAVLPFIDDSPEEGNEYIVNGLMEEILDKLQNIGELKVKSRTDVEKYRDTKKSTSEIARELHVNFLLEGSGQKIDEQIKLSLQLIETSTGNHIWSKIYTENIEDIFLLQENVAVSVASELNATITPEEKREIEKLPTENAAAHNLYLLGLEYYRVGVLSFKNSDNTNFIFQNSEAKKCFEQAILIDSTFADAYYQLSHFYIDLIYFYTPTFLNPALRASYLDAGYYYIQKTLEYDNQHENAMKILIKYYLRKGMNNEADNAEKRLMKIAKKDYHLFEFLMEKSIDHEQFYEFIKYYYEFQKIKPADQETQIHFDVYFFYFTYLTGFPEIAREVAEELLIRDNDSITYWDRLNAIAYFYENDHTLKYLLKAYHKDTTLNIAVSNLKIFSMLNRNYDDALYYLLKEKNNTKEREKDQTFHVINGFIYKINGFEQEAEIEINGNEKRNQDQIKMNLLNAQLYHSHGMLSAIYAVRGEKEKALNYMKEIKNRHTYAYPWIEEIKISPLSDNLRDEPEFQEVIDDLETKYRKEHERIAEFLRDLGEIV